MMLSAIPSKHIGGTCLNGQQHDCVGLRSARKSFHPHAASTKRPYGLTSVYHHSTLEDCATAIATSINKNKRYEHYRGLTPQEKHGFAARDAVASRIYWEGNKAALDAAMSTEHGLFKGCHNIVGPLDDETKHRILSYLNQPSQKGWLDIRGTVVAGPATLWQAWIAADASAPRAGDKGFPDPEPLRQAIRKAVEARQAEVESKPLPSLLTA